MSTLFELAKVLEKIVLDNKLSIDDVSKFPDLTKMKVKKLYRGMIVKNKVERELTLTSWTTELSVAKSFAGWRSTSEATILVLYDVEAYSVQAIYDYIISNYENEEYLTAKNIGMILDRIESYISDEFEYLVPFVYNEPIRTYTFLNYNYEELN